MRTIYAIGIWSLFLLLGFWSCRVKEGSDIPIEVFFNKPDKTNFQISPNGRFVSYLQKHKGVRNIFVMDVETQKTERITSEVDIDIRYSFWADNDELIFFKDRRPGDSLRLMAVNRNISTVRYVLPPTTANIRWVGPGRVLDDKLLIALNSRDSSVFDVYRLHVKDCNLEMIAKNPGNIVDWFPDGNGELRIAVASNGLTETILYRDKEEDDFKEAVKNNFKTSVEVLGFSNDDPNCIYALSNENRDKKALVEMDLRSGRENVLFNHAQVDIKEGGYAEQRGVMDFAAFDTWKPERHFFNSDMEQVFAAIEKHLPGYVIKIEGKDSADSRFIIHAFTDTNPGAYYYYDIQKNQLVDLADINPALDRSSLSSTKPVTYVARDGKLIHAYLTLPKNSKKRNLPLIVMPHNGPEARTVWGYDAEVQFLVSRGFAVFQPNYRGSSGYGKDFWIESFKGWGTKVQDDITDGTEWLIDEGIADPKRIGIYGFSFGGYSALHAACFNSDLYACAASYSGMTNLYTYLKEIPPYYTPHLQMLYEIVGDPEKDGDYFRNHSPIFHADNVNIPIFIAQGGKDSRSSVSETNHFVKELRKNGVKVTYRLEDEEGHYFRNEENRIALYRALADFFEKNLRP